MARTSIQLWKRLLTALGCPLVAVFSLGVVHPGDLQAQATVYSLRSDVKVRWLMNTGTAVRSLRLARDPRYAALYYLKQNGDIYQVNPATATSTLVYTSLNHGVSNPQGFAIGPTGVFYLVGNVDRPNTQTRATIVRGLLDARGQRVWSILAQTADYPKSYTAFDHRFNGIVVDPSGSWIYVNSGSRTDHGEVQSAGGLYPNTREVGLTACILRLPTNGQNIFLPNDRASLKQSGFVFAEGTRNSFDLAFAANGNLFATENGPDRDMSEELNWLRAGLHYGFPWRMGGADNPQQFVSYDPNTDVLLDPRFTAVKNGYYRNDPTFPPRPPIALVEPIVNAGPNADSYRDSQDGQIKDASTLNQTLSTFTTHRSPLGLVFDTMGALASDFNGSGFMLSWTQGDPTGNTVAGPFMDPGQDLVHLDFTKPTASSYRIRTTRIVGGFSNPIDAELSGNRMYVLEYGNAGGLWEISLPVAPNMIQNGSFETTGSTWLSPWTFRNDLGGTISQDGTTKASGVYSAKVGIPQSSASPWVMQLGQKNKILTAGKTYTVSLWAKASVPRAIDVMLQQSASPYTLYVRKTITLTTSWQEYRLSYRALVTDPNAALRLNLAQAPGHVWLDNVSLRTVAFP